MTKTEFISELKKRLSGLPKEEIDERISFYGEMIDDRVEDGRTEEEAVSDIGTVDEVSAQIIADTPLTKIAKERIKPKRKLRAWEIVLLVLGSPIWLSLAIVAAAIILALYIVLWSVIVCLWSVFASFVACALGGMVSGVVIAFTENAVSGIAVIGLGFVCAGLAIFSFFGCKAATKGIVVLTKKIAIGIKKCFMRKEKSDE